MIASGDLAQRTKAITDELHALKSTQNMGANGLTVGGHKEIAVSETLAYPTAGEYRSFVLDFTLTNNITNVPPISNMYCAVFPRGVTYISETSFYCRSVSGNSVIWRFSARYRVDDQSGSFPISGTAYCHSLVDATLTYRRIT